jgi:enterochelin esterase-like enzyme
LTNEFSQRVQTCGNPLIDGHTATFVWLGDQIPILVGDFTDWERGAPAEMRPVDEEVWIYQLELPLDAYIEYAYLEGEDHLPDPFNPHTTPTGVGKRNHYFYMPQAAPSPLTKSQRRRQRGLVTKHVLPTEGLLAGRQRQVWLYQPPVDDPVPLIVVWDGKDYLRRARLPIMLDNLIAQQRIQPVALALVQNGGAARTVEYACSEASLLFLQVALLPLAYTHLNLLDFSTHIGAFGVLGASLGGLMALHTALRLPQIFGKALCQSGAYSLGFFDTISFDLVRSADPSAVKVWLDVGLYDFENLLSANQRMRDVMAERGFTFEYRQYPAGHNYPAWRDEVWRGLEFLFPPAPLS